MFKFEKEGDLKILDVEGGYSPPQVMINGQCLTSEIEEIIKETFKKDPYLEVGHVEGKWKITLEKIED